MPSIHRLLWGMLVLAGVGAAQAAPQDAPAAVTLAATSRVYVTLVPRTAEPDEVGGHRGDSLSPGQAYLNLPLSAARRNRLEFSLTRTDVVAQGDRLQLRLASDAHVIAQLLTGGQFSEADDSWIAMLGLASRVRLSYQLGGWELSVSARRKFGEGDVRARLAYAIRF
jgi:hypothetical protein